MTRSLCSPPPGRERPNRNAIGEGRCPVVGVGDGDRVSERPVPDGPGPGTGTDVPSGAVVATVAELRAAWPDLRNAAVIGLDLRHEDLDWTAARIDRTILLGCRLPTGVAEPLANAGVGILRAPDGLPFDPFRTHLYTYDELTEGESPHLDDRIAAWFAASTMSVHDEWSEPCTTPP